MRHRIVIAISIVALITTAVAAQNSWSTRTRAGEYAFARGNYDAAEAEFRAALDIANGFPEGDRRLETSLLNLGRLYEHQSAYEKAVPMYQLLLAAKEHRLGLSSAGLLDALFAVARSSQPMGDLPTVTDSLRRYAEIADATDEADPRKHWQALDMLARMKVIQERSDEALKWQLKAVNVIDDDPRADATEKASVVQSAANLALTTGDTNNAEKLLAEVAILKSAAGSDESTALIMAHGAATAFGAGQFDTAERIASRALEAGPDAGIERMARSTLADVSWAKANRGTDDLSILLEAAGSDPALDAASERLRAVVELENGENPETLRRLVQVEVLRDQPGAALTWQRRLIELGSMMDISTLRAHANLVTLLAATGDYDAALAENAKTINMVEDEQGRGSAQLSPLYEQRIDVAQAAGNNKEAKRAQKKLRKLNR
jgi:tetratricopeptide (TPR) repeat protein